MGIFRFLKNSEKRKNADIDLAEALLTARFSPAEGQNNSRQVEKFLKKYPAREAVIEKVTELCGEPVTSRQRYILAYAWMRSKIENRDKAIAYLELYLANQPYEGAFRNAHHFLGSSSFTPDEEKNIHLAHMYCHLGREYEGKSSYNQALAMYRKEMELTPFYAAPFCRAAATRVKKNQMVEAMNILAGAKRSHYYSPVRYTSASGEIMTEDTFRKTIDSHILELEKKIRNGYAYIPKKKKA